MGRRPLGQDSFHKGTQWYVHFMAYYVSDSLRLLYIPEFSLYIRIQVYKVIIQCRVDCGSLMLLYVCVVDKSPYTDDE